MCAGLVAAALTIFVPVTSADAEAILFNTDPFAGTTALETPDRQIIGDELFVPDFDLTTDAFLFDTTAFGVDSLWFQNSPVADLPPSGVNVVIVRDTDSDNDPGTPFRAGTAAGLIASQTETPTPGFFVYHNSGLEMNRLVFSTDLSDPTADLKILARLTSPTGGDAVALMPSFSAANFRLVPEPSGALLAATAGLALAFRREKKVPRRGRSGN